MGKPTTLGMRMKEYEQVTQTRLSRRVPVIIRVDGKAFHTLTRGLDRPFDAGFIHCMEVAAIALCKQVQGCQMAYVQSDEISLLLTDWDRYDTDAWFDYRIQKIASVASSIAAVHFNSTFHAKHRHDRHREKVGYFDARVFNVPMHEAINYFIWRQIDWIRNSVHMLGRAHFSAKQLHRQSGLKVRGMLEEEGVRWEEQPIHLQRGTVIRKLPKVMPTYVDKAKGQIRIEDAGTLAPGSDVKALLEVRERHGETQVRPLKAQVTRLDFRADREPPEFTTPEGRGFLDSFLMDVFWKEERPSSEDV
jgi:tRNA(His) guanylyltransferase